MKKDSLPTFVFIDASNIKHACVESCGFALDFNKLIKYFKRKYPSLKNVLYYEGIAKDDVNKVKIFHNLKRQGYTIHSLRRKAYEESAICRTISCKKCKHKQEIEILPKKTKVKSNVDVYLATDMMEYAIDYGKKGAHFIIMSCDGDYCETIFTLLRRYQKLYISVLATPFIKNGKNYLSSRLRAPLRGEHSDRYNLVDINTVRDFVSKKPHTVAEHKKCETHRRASR